MNAAPLVISIVALVIAVASFGLSAFVAFRDSARLKILSTFYDASEFGPDRIHVTVINKGRRVAILRLIGGTDDTGEYAGQFIDHEKGGHRLAENERYECDITKDDTLTFVPDGIDHIFKNLSIEDSLGVRHDVPDSEELIKKLWA